MTASPAPLSLCWLLADAAAAGGAFPHVLGKGAARLSGGPDRALALKISEGLQSGTRLSSLLAAVGFRPFDVALVVCGEETGRLPEMLRILADSTGREESRRLERRQGLRRPLVSAATVVFSFAFLLLVAIPRLAELTRGWGPPISLSVRVLFWLERWRMAALSIMALAPLLAVIFELGSWTQSGRRIGRRLWRGWPLSRGAALDSWSRFAESLAVLLEGGVPLPSARAFARGTAPRLSFRLLLRNAARRDPYGMSSLLFPYPLASALAPATDARALAADLREGARLARGEAEMAGRRATAVLAGLLLLLVSASALLALWIVFGPLLTLAAADPFA